MSRGRIVIRGELHLSLEVVAECYDCQVSWVREVYELGLLGEGSEVEGGIAVSAAMLERMARIRRLNLQLGLPPEMIALMLS